MRGIGLAFVRSFKITSAHIRRMTGIEIIFEESKRAVEIQTMKAEAEVEPLRWLAEQLQLLKQNGPDAIPGYLRNVRLDLYKRARRIILDKGQ